MMNEINFQSIFDRIQSVLPPSWDEIVFYASYTAGSYSMKYYVKTGAEILDCFKQTNISKTQLIRIFMDIDKELTPIRKSLPETEVWTVFTMVVDAKGNMKTHFDYADLTENTIEYERKWKQTYL